VKAVVNGAPVVIDGQPVQVYFNYTTEQVAYGKRKDPVEVRGVECVIRPFPASEGEDTLPLSTGVALCSPLDNFNKAEGRFLAWKRAVQESPRFTRAQRQALWAWFTTTCRLPNT
jgi:hypothetical protein